MDEKRVVAVVAHNEERNIIRCLDSVRLQTRSGDRCFVLNNGSSDGTASLVREYAARHPFVSLVEIEVGDKSNAWNHLVHDVRPSASIYYFLDGDCELCEGALDALERLLRSNPTVNAAAAVPAPGLGKSNRRELLAGGGLAGNLYALSTAFVERIRTESVRLPCGLIGDDSLVGALAYWDLDPRGKWDLGRIVVCREACFRYVPLSVLSIRDLRVYYRRKNRYALRHIQNQLLRKSLKANGLAGILSSIDQLYVRDMYRLRWRGIDTYFDCLALLRIRRGCSVNGGN